MEFVISSHLSYVWKKEQLTTVFEMLNMAINLPNITKTLCSSDELVLVPSCLFVYFY